MMKNRKYWSENHALFDQKVKPKNPIKGYEERIPGDSMEGVFKRFKIIF